VEHLVISSLDHQKTLLTTRILEDEYSNRKLKFVWEKQDRIVVKKLKRMFLKTRDKHS